MEGQEDQDFSKLSLEERVTHKNWKARVSGYEELAQKFPLFEDKEFNKYSPLIKKFVLDTNAAAQEKGLAAVLPYVDYCPNAGKYIESIVAGLATKCLNSTRSKTKELAHDIVLMCVEVEKQDVVLEELIKGLEQKTPKNVAACVRMITKCLNQFGSKVIAIKPIVPSLSKLLEDRDPTVRDDTKLLAIEIYRWVKDALLPQLSNLKPILLDSLKGEFENVKAVKPSPERLLRSQQQRAQDDVDSGAGGTAGDGPDESGPAPEEEVDPFEFMEAVDIVSKLPSDFYTLIEAKKWQERKESLEKLQQLLEAHPKLVTTSDYGELIKQLKRIIGKDTNIVVATLAIKCLSMLVIGLRKGFDKHANSCVSVVLEKFKEKKTNVVQSLREAIDAIYLQTSLEAIQEDLTTSLANKNPSIRSETALFLARSFAKTNPNLVNKKLLKTLVTSLLTTLGDSDPTVRESSAEALGTAAKAQGDRNMLPLLQGLEQLKMAKIDEYKAKVEVKKFAAAPPPPAPAAAPPKAKPAPPKRTGGARVVKPAPAPNYSSQESLNDLLPEPPAPKAKPAASKFGTMKSRLDTGSARSTASDGSATTNASSAKYGTVKRPGTVGGASRLAKPGGIPSAGSSRKTDDPSVASAMMLPNVKAKEQRFADEKALKVLKWNFTSPREEFYIQLKEQMQAADWNAALVTNLFHSDFKYHIKGIDGILDFFSKDSNATECVVANLDLILKWIALRFFDTNPSVIMKALELLLVMFKILEASGYSMIDVEANSFFPYLVLKVGDPKDVVRNKVHEILIKLRNLYPANKIFSHLLAGLQSKNSRQRATCLEELALLIELKGMAIFQPPNSIQEVKGIAKFLSERDNGVRNGALNCIVQVYFIEGEKVLKMVGNLSDKEMSLIEERIKRASKQQPQRIPSTASNIPETNGFTGPGSGLPTLGGGIPQRIASASQLYQHASDPEVALPPASVSKLSSLSNLMSKMNLDGAAGTPNGGGSPYDTYSKPKGFGTGKRTLSGVGFGPKGLGLKPSGLALPNRLDFGNNSVEAEHRSDTESMDYINGNSGSASGSSLSEIVRPTEEPMDTDVESILTATSSTDDDLDRRVKEALALPDLNLHRIERIRQRTSTGSISTRTSFGTGLQLTNSPMIKPTFNQELNDKFLRILSDLSNQDIMVVYSALDHLNNAFKEYDKYAQYIEPKIDQLIALTNKQLRLFMRIHYPESEGNENARKKAEMVYRAVCCVLHKVFKLPVGKRISRDTIRELITHLLPFFLELRDNKNIFQTVNMLISELIKGADTTNLLSALIRMLHDYVGSVGVAGNGSSPPKTAHLDTYLELTMKFIWRLVKFFDEHSSQLNVDVILYESHLFFKSYPRTWWKVNNRDDLPLRTIKTLIYLIVRQKGDSILSNFTMIENKDESELSYYVQKSLRQCENQQGDKKNSSTVSIGSTISTTGVNGLTPANRSALTINGTSANKTGTDENSIHVNGNASEKKLTPAVANGVARSTIPRVFNSDFPLRTRQLNNLTNMNGLNVPVSTPPTIPVIRTEDDLRKYCEYTNRQLNMNIDYDAIQQKAKLNSRIVTVDDAQRAVNLARERLANLQSRVVQNPVNLPSSG